MKKRCIAVLIFWALLVGILLPIRKKAFAYTGMEAAAAATWAIGNSLGINWSIANANSGFTQDWMETQIQNYDNGQSLIDSMVGNIAVDAAGKLAIGQIAYNNVCEFIDYLKDIYDLGNAFIGADGHVFDPQNIGDTLNGWAPYPGGEKNESGYYREGWSLNGALPGYAPTSGIWEYDSMSVSYYSTRGVITYHYHYGAQIRNSTASKNYSEMGISTVQTQDFEWPSEYSLPTVLNPDKEWTGLIGGESHPDINLDQLIDSIFQDVADNNISVDGEIIDVPVPPGPIPTWTPVDDVIDGINGLGEVLDGIGNDIGDISGHLDDIGDQIDDMTGAIEGVQEGIQTQTGVISGAIEQATQDVVDAIGEQTVALDETLTETAAGVQDIAEALQPGEIEPKKFDLRRLFPFCIPFDIHNLLQKFNATPVAPHVQLPFVIQSLGFSYTFDLDFSAFDPVAQAMRTVEFIVFAIGLAWATSKVIKW